MIRITLSTGALTNRFSFTTISRIAAATGLDGLEVVVNGKVARNLSRYRSEIFENTEVPVLSLHAPYHLIGALGKNLASEIIETAKIAQEAGIKRVVFHPPHIPFFQPHYYQSFIYGNLIKELKKFDVVPVMETLSKRAAIAGFNHPFRLIDFARQRGLYIALDCSHVSSWGLEPVEVYEYGKDVIKTIHLNNTHECSIDQHNPPDKGCIDIEALLRKISTEDTKEELHLVLEIDFSLLPENKIEKIIEKAVFFTRGCLA